MSKKIRTAAGLEKPNAKIEITNPASYDILKQYPKFDDIKITNSKEELEKMIHLFDEFNQSYFNSIITGGKTWEEPSPEKLSQFTKNLKNCY